MLCGESCEVAWGQVTEFTTLSCSLLLRYNGVYSSDYGIFNVAGRGHHWVLKNIGRPEIWREPETTTARHSAQPPQSALSNVAYVTEVNTAAEGRALRITA